MSLRASSSAHAVESRLQPAAAGEPIRIDAPASLKEQWRTWSKPRWWPVWVLLGWCGVLFFLGISVGELWRTEGLRAIIAQEMLHSGDWIVPRLYGEPLFTKPPGMYLAIVLCSLPFGQVTEWTARLPSALAATLCVFLFYWYFKQRLGQRAGLIAALLLPLVPMWLDKASAAEIDMLQVAWVTGSLIFLFRALDEHDGGARGPLAEIDGQASRLPYVWWLLAMLCVAGGTLTKWTAPAFFYATAITLLWRRGQLRLLWSRPHLVSAALAGALCLAWVSAAVSREGWDIFFATVGREGLARIVPGYLGHPYRWDRVLLHPLIIWLNTLPLSLAAMWALRPAFRQGLDEPGRRIWQEMNCWIWPNLIIWSLMTEHTPRHSFPLFPGVAGLAALVWIGWVNGSLRWRLPGLSPGRVFVGCLAAWLALKAVYVFAIMPARTAGRDPADKASVLARLVPLGNILYLFHLKDEGIMFYYGRPVLRLASPGDLPASPTPVYCILTRAEWDAWTLPRPTEILQEMTDEQGDPCVLVRVGG